jgi:hypothetical protein
MTTHDALLIRIRSEYTEMPGMHLTLRQACRLWHLEGALCATLLEDLVADRFLRRTPRGTYCSLNGCTVE